MKPILYPLFAIWLGLIPSLLFGQLPKGKQLFYKGDYNGSVTLFKEVLQTSSLPAEKQEALFWLGMCAENTSALPLAIAHYRQLDTVIHTLKHWRLKAKGQLVICYLRINDLVKAEHTLNQLNKEKFSIAEKGYIDQVNGTYYYNTSNYRQALKYHQQAVKIFEAQHDSLALLSAYVNLANDYKLNGNTAQALTFYTLSQNLHERLGSVLSLAQCYESMGMIFMERYGFVAWLCWLAFNRLGHS